MLNYIKQKIDFLRFKSYHLPISCFSSFDVLQKWDNVTSKSLVRSIWKFSGKIFFKTIRNSSGFLLAIACIKSWLEQIVGVKAIIISKDSVVIQLF